MLTIKVKSQDVIPGDVISTITGDVATVKTNKILDLHCLLHFDNGLCFHLKKDEEFEVRRNTVREPIIPPTKL